MHRPDSALTAARTRRFTTAALAAVVVVATWYVAVATATGQLVDSAAMLRAAALSDRLRGVDHALLRVVSPASIAAAMVGVAAIAVVRRRVGLGARAALIIAGASVTTQVVKGYLLWRPSLGDGVGAGNSYPSGHVTAAAAAAVALTIVVTPALRGTVAALGGTWTALMGIAVVINEWHRPSDVIGAIAVVGAWAFLFSPLEEGPVLARGRRTLTTVATVVGILALALGVLTLTIATPADLLPGGGVKTSVGALAAAWSGIAAIVSASLFLVGGVNKLHAAAKVPRDT